MLHLANLAELPATFAWAYRHYATTDYTAAVVRSVEPHMASTWIACINERIGNSGVHVTVGMHRANEGRTNRVMSSEVLASRFVARWIELRIDVIRRELREIERQRLSGWQGHFRREPLPPAL